MKTDKKDTFSTSLTFYRFIEEGEVEHLFLCDCKLHICSMQVLLTYCFHPQATLVLLSLDLNPSLPPQITPLSWFLLIYKATLFIPQAKWLSVGATTSVINLHVFCLHGLPRNIFSNQGHQFVSRLCSLQGNMGLNLSAGFHLQSIVQAQRANEGLEMKLQCFSSPSVFLVWTEYELNSLQFSATGLLPSECQTCLRENRVKRKWRVKF